MQAPKKKTSKSKRNMRRSHHSILARSSMDCPKCGELKLPHRMCPSCGTYKGRVFKKEEPVPVEPEVSE